MLVATFIRLIASLALSASNGADTRPTFDPQEIAGQHPIEMQTPAPDFFAGGLLGNGGLGAVVCTRPDAVVIHFGHNEVWDIRIAEENRDKIVPFDELWTRVKRNTPEDRSWFGNYCSLMQQNYSKPYPRPWPCGTLLFGFDRRQAELLGHTVRIDTGTCEVRFLIDGQPATLQVFTDMAADRLWMRMVDAQGRPAPAPFNRVRLVPEKGMQASEKVEGNQLSFRQVLPVLGDVHEKDKAVQVTVALTGQVKPEFKLGGPFIACAELRQGLAKDVTDSLASSAGPSEAAFQQAQSSSRAAWRDYWSRAGVRLEDKFLEGVWYHNLYFVNCSLRPGVTCPGLFANWSKGEIGTAWHGDYHTNYNLEQPFWVTFSSNHVDKHLPYVDLVHFMVPVSQRWARDYYKLPGAYFPHTAYPVEMSFLPYPVPDWGGEVCETPWVVQSLWWHYLYTMDQGYLRDRAFGPIREAVRFLNAYMRRPEAHGQEWKDDKYHIYPTVAPELHGLRPEPGFCADCIVDLALTKFVFKAYLEACMVLGMEREEAELMAQVREILNHFPEYPTATSKQGKVFVSVAAESSEQVYNVPNCLAPVFPGEDIGLHSPPEVLKTAIDTWRNQQNEGGNELVFLNLQGARLGALDLEKFKRQIRYCLLPDGTCADMVLQVGGRYVDETDFAYMAPMGVWFENFSLPVVINECLLQSYSGTLRFFPNWPVKQDAAFQNLRAAGAFLVSAELSKGRVAWIRIESEAGSQLRLINPWNGPVEVRRGDTTSVQNGRELVLPTQKGEVLWFREGGDVH